MKLTSLVLCIGVFVAVAVDIVSADPQSYPLICRGGPSLRFR